MCGRLNVIDDPSVIDLCEQLGLDIAPANAAYQRRFVRATDRVEIIFQTDLGFHRIPATWWLLLEKYRHDDGSINFKPSRYTSFNTRWDKLNVPRSAGYHSFRHQRCIVLVKGFGESQKTSGGMQYTDFMAEKGRCIALAGLYRLWQPGNVVSFSIITTPAHPKLAPYHQKASPLMLAQHNGEILEWLDPSLTEAAKLEVFLQPQLTQNLIAQPINKPSLYQPIAAPINIAMD